MPDLRKFDVISIRQVPPNASPILREPGFTPILPGGQFVDPRMPVSSMIAIAYDVKNFSTQLTGLPTWAKEQAFAVAAKPAPGFPLLPPSENREQVRAMLRAMLADRFHLQLHTEIRQEPVFHLEVAKGGPKMTAVDPPVPPAKESPVGAAMGNNGGRLVGNKSTMAGLATALAIFLKRPVLDQTGLKGYYDFDVKWSSPETPDAPPAPPGFGADGAGLLISVLPNQLGLRVSKAVGPVEYWVVDHIETPTSN